MNVLHWFDCYQHDCSTPAHRAYYGNITRVFCYTVFTEEEGMTQWYTDQNGAILDGSPWFIFYETRKQMTRRLLNNPDSSPATFGIH